LRIENAIRGKTEAVSEALMGEPESEAEDAL
jgi:hypothetical protein